MAASGGHGTVVVTMAGDGGGFQEGDVITFGGVFRREPWHLRWLAKLRLRKARTMPLVKYRIVATSGRQTFSIEGMNNPALERVTNGT